MTNENEKTAEPLEGEHAGFAVALSGDAGEGNVALSQASEEKSTNGE